MIQYKYILNKDRKFNVLMYFSNTNQYMWASGHTSFDINNPVVPSHNTYISTSYSTIFDFLLDNAIKKYILLFLIVE